MALLSIQTKFYYPCTPWKGSPDLVSRLTPSPCENGFMRAVVSPTDPEAKFVQEIFEAHKPPHVAITKISYLYKSLKEFEKELRGIDEAAKKAPVQRSAALDAWKSSTDPFSPLEIPLPLTDPPENQQLSSVRVLPLWFLNTPQMSKNGHLCYLTSSARHANTHPQDFLMLAWVAMPLPIVVSNCASIETHEGELRKTYYIPLKNPSSPYSPYTPCLENETPNAGEFIVNYSQTLSCFQVELSVSSPEHLFRFYTAEALHVAAYKGHLEPLKRWIEEDFSRLYEKNHKEETLWQTAMRGSQLLVLDWLCAKDTKVLNLPAHEEGSLVQFARSINARPSIHAWIFCKQNPEMKELPNFMAIGMDLQKGPYVSIEHIRPPLSVWEVYEEGIKNVSNKSSTAAFIGGAIGAVLGLVINFRELKREETREEGARNTLSLAGFFAFGGGILGAMKGIHLTYQLTLDQTRVKNSLTSSAEQAKAILDAFVTSQMQRTKNLELITCPLSNVIMAFPTKVKCGSEQPHIFEYFAIAKWLSDPTRKQSCPTCHKTGMKIEELLLDDQRGKLVIEQSRRIFIALEAILNRLPKTLFGWGATPHFSASEQMAFLTKIIEAGKPFLEQPTDQIIQKIASNQLSEVETYALSHYLIYRIQPVQDKIDKIFTMATSHLFKLWLENQISKKVRDEQMQQLEGWYAKTRPIPEECVTLRQLYQVKEMV